MKRIILIMLAATLIPVAAIAGKGGGGGGKNLAVEVRSAAVKSQPSYMSSTVATLSYGQGVSVVSEQNNWIKIATPAGWLPRCSVTKSSANVKSEAKISQAGANHDETALAGKGFNPSVEKQYMKDNSSLEAAYGFVDKVEKFTISDGALRQFVAAGQLKD